MLDFLTCSELCCFTRTLIIPWLSFPPNVSESLFYFLNSKLPIPDSWEEWVCSTCQLLSIRWQKFSPRIADNIQATVLPNFRHELQELEDVNVLSRASLKRKIFPKGWINKWSLLMECSFVSRHDREIKCVLTEREWHQKNREPNPVFCADS